ncbi:MAG: J domain-containing protein [Cyanobacteria bacterium CRU_2_1]|nr:J domain-containing protein [Cyanobacteria bacterium RU_5_0]NJR59897.1 J domain-containing protein [Cyanobacteria bacterium CRU_2_1]
MSAGKKSQTYYELLNLHPSASAQEVRRAYRELSKLYHPDTTTLPSAIATAKFQHLNEAYATLSSPERRVTYDLKIGYSRFFVIQSTSDLNRPVSESRKFQSAAYLDPTDRPLSAGELFALFIIGLTFIACVALVIFIGLTRGDTAFQPLKTLGDDAALYNLAIPEQDTAHPGDWVPIAPLPPEATPDVVNKISLPKID